MQLKVQLLPLRTRARPGLPLKNPKSITVHWIGPFPNQTIGIPRDWWEKGPDGRGLEASAHFIIKDEDVLACVPTDEVAWHCGCKGNYESIGIEVIPENIEGRFSIASLSTLYVLIDKLEKEFGRLELKRHFDWTQKDCPRYYTPLVPDGQDRWDELVALKRAGKR